MVVGSPVFQSRVEELFDILPICIPTIANTDYFNLSDFTPEKYRVVSVGNLKEAKGHRDVIQAFHKGLKGVDASLVIIGDGEDRRVLETMITDYNEQDRVTLLGQRDLAFIAKEFSQSSLFVLASHSETYGKVYVEAMNAGLPIITTENGGSEQFVKSFNGVIAKVKDTESLSNAFVYMYENRDSFDKEKIRAFAQENFSEDVATNQHIKLYEELLSSYKS